MPTWTSNIPSQVKTYANLSAFPATGSVKTIYIAEDTDIAYYWTGSAYQSISIQNLSGLVPYTGATTDVDLGNNDLNAEGIKIKGTAGNGHLGMKHQSSNPTAGGQETVIFAGADGEPRFKNDGNAVEQFASREWVNLQGFQTTPIVVNSNITAQNDTVYHVVASATFTDPTPVEGKGYIVFLRNGSVTIGGVSNANSGTVFYRIYRGTSWITYSHYDITTLQNTFVPQTRTINGLDLTANRTLTTANINDSSNKRYVTDAQLTVIGNTSGTNTGDQDLSGLVPNTRTVNGYDLTANRTLTASDVGAVATNSPITGATKTKITFDAKGLVTSGADATTADISDSSNKRYVTDAQQTILNKTLLNDKLIAGSSVNVTAESILGTFTINANTLSANDVIKIMASTIKVGTAGVHTLRIRHNTSNTLVGATQIAIVSVTNTANINVTFSRQNLVVTGGNLTASFPFGNSSLTDINSQLTTAPSSTAFDVTVTNYFFITVVLGSASDSISLRFATIQNF